MENSEKVVRDAEGRPLVTGVFRDRDSAERAYQSLSTRGYTDKDVSLLMSDDTRKRHFHHEHGDKETGLGNKALEGAGVGAGVGGALGATILGLVAAGTSLAVPGLGLIIAGPLAGAIAGAGVGGATGTLVGALVGAGIPEERAKLYDNDLREGGIVMGVRPRSDADAQQLEEELRQYNGEHVYR